MYLIHIFAVLHGGVHFPLLHGSCLCSVEHNKSMEYGQNHVNKIKMDGSECSIAQQLRHTCGRG